MALDNIQIADILDFAHVGIFQCDGDWNCIFVNSEYCRLTEISEQEQLGRGWTSLYQYREGRLVEIVANLLSEQSYRSQLSVPLSNGDVRHLELELRAYVDDDKIKSIVGVVYDISERVKRHNELTQLSSTDRLTGLQNRTSMQEQLLEYLRIVEKLGLKIYVVFIHLNNFSQINDLYGYVVGDQLISEAGQRIKPQLSSANVISRFSNNEFALLIHQQKDKDWLEQKLQAIERALKTSYVINELNLFLSVSIGVAHYVGQSDVAEFDAQAMTVDLFKQADIAMHNAKDDRETNIVFYDSEQGNRVSSLYAICHLLPRAIAEKEFVVHYQPIICVHSGRVEKIEALLRWHTEEFGFVSPEQIIAIAEREGLIIEVEECILECIARDLAILDSSGKSSLESLNVSINLSGFQLSSEVLTSTFSDTVKALGISPDRVVVEITEQVLVSDNNEAINHIAHLKREGFRIALDDFGTGYSSLSYLTNFPIDYIKLDRSFISGASLTSKQQALIQGVVALSQSLDLEVVAEGVETSEDLDLLKESRCHYLQGYFYTRPLPIEQLIDWIADYEK